MFRNYVVLLKIYKVIDKGFAFYYSKSAPVNSEIKLITVNINAKTFLFPTKGANNYGADQSLILRSFAFRNILILLTLQKVGLRRRPKRQFCQRAEKKSACGSIKSL